MKHKKLSLYFICISAFLLLTIIFIFNIRVKSEMRFSSLNPEDFNDSPELKEIVTSFCRPNDLKEIANNLDRLNSYNFSQKTDRRTLPLYYESFEKSFAFLKYYCFLNVIKDRFTDNFPRSVNLYEFYKSNSFSNDVYQNRVNDIRRSFFEPLLTDDRTFSQFTNHLEAYDKTTRGYIIAFLGRLRDKRASPYLLDLLEKENSEYFKRNISLSLCNMGESKILKYISSCITDPKMSYINSYLTEYLGNINKDEAIKLLDKLAEDPSDSTVDRVVYTLRQYDLDRAKPILTKLLSHKSFEIKIFAAETLTYLGDESGPEEISKLIEKYEGYKDCKSKIATTLNFLHDKKGIVPPTSKLLVYMEEELPNNYYDFVTLEKILLLNGDKLKVHLIKPLLDSDDPQLQALACECFYLSGDKTVLDKILKFKSSTNRKSRIFFSRFTGDYHVMDFYKDLVELLNDPESEVMIETIESLGKLGDKKALESLLAFAQTNKTNSLYAVFKALIKYKDERIYELLVNHANSNNLFLQYHAIDALGEYNDKRALPLLINALKDTNVLVRASSKRSS